MSGEKPLHWQHVFGIHYCIAYVWNQLDLELWKCFRKKKHFDANLLGILKTFTNRLKKRYGSKIKRDVIQFLLKLNMHGKLNSNSTTAMPFYERSKIYDLWFEGENGKFACRKRCKLFFLIAHTYLYRMTAFHRGFCWHRFY